jgi:Zn finger protein HypA/HybF involved in hydrogenase expression
MKGEDMILCEYYYCENCGCCFYHPELEKYPSATKTINVNCPKCGSDNCHIL